MVIRKCDRCGKAYEKNIKHPTRGTIAGSEVAGIVTKTWSKGLDEEYDLCDECIEKLFNWLKNDEGVENDEQNQ